MEITHSSRHIDLPENVSRSSWEHSTLMLNAQGQGLDHVVLESNAHVTSLSLDINLKKKHDKKAFK